MNCQSLCEVCRQSLIGSIENMLKVIIGEKQPLYRAGVVKVLTETEEFKVIAQCADWLGLYDAVSSHTEALIIASTRIVSNVEELVSLSRGMRSRILLIGDDEESKIRYRTIGIAGMVRRSSEASDFLEYARRVRDGAAFVPANDVTTSQDSVGARIASSLTRSEKRIVGLLVEGMRNRDMAQKLNVTEQVVKNHLRVIFDKTGMSDRLELVIFTMRHQALSMAVADTLAESAHMLA